MQLDPKRTIHKKKNRNGNLILMTVDKISQTKSE